MFKYMDNWGDWQLVTLRISSLRGLTTGYSACELFSAIFLDVQGNPALGTVFRSTAIQAFEEASCIKYIYTHIVPLPANVSRVASTKPRVNQLEHFEANPKLTAENFWTWPRYKGKKKWKELSRWEKEILYTNPNTPRPACSDSDPATPAVKLRQETSCRPQKRAARGQERPSRAPMHDVKRPSFCYVSRNEDCVS